MGKLVTITAPAPEPTEYNNGLLDALSKDWDVTDGDPIAAPYGWLSLTCSKHFSGTVIRSLKRSFKITPTEVTDAN